MPKIVYIDQSGKEYTATQFIRYIETKVKRTIRKYDMIGNNDTFVVAMSGGKDSLTVAHILNTILAPRGAKLHALLIDEGIPGYRPTTVVDAEKFCKQEGIPLTIVYTKKEFTFDLTDALKKLKLNSCTICGTMRRYLLNKYSRKLKATKLVTGHNLDDEAQTLLMNHYKGQGALSAKLGPVTGIVDHKKFVRRIKPLYFITEQEVTLYTVLKKFAVKYTECPHARDTFRSTVREQLNILENKFRGTKQGIVNSFLATLPQLRKIVQQSAIIPCEVCGEPSSKKECSMCLLLDKYKLKS